MESSSLAATFRLRWFGMKNSNARVATILAALQTSKLLPAKLIPVKITTMPDDLPLDDEAIDQIWQNAPPALPSAKELARAKELLAAPNHPHNLYPAVKPPQTRLQVIIGHLPLESQRKIVAALRAALPEHNRMAVRHAIEKAKTQTKH
jgi:hypothetical protein